MTASDLNQAEVRTLLATDIPDQLNAIAASRISTDPIAELDQMTGLASVKRQVRLLAAEAFSPAEN